MMNGGWCRCWETLMVVMVAYSAWVCPYEIAFLNSNPSPPLYIADNIVDIFFAVDIILTFFVAYIDSTTQLLVVDSKKIAKRYLQFLIALNLFISHHRSISFILLSESLFLVVMLYIMVWIS